MHARTHQEYPTVLTVPGCLPTEAWVPVMLDVRFFFGGTLVHDIEYQANLSDPTLKQRLRAINPSSSRRELAAANCSVRKIGNASNRCRRMMMMMVPACTPSSATC